VGGLLRISFVALLVYGGLMGLTYLGFRAVPIGFIPEQDKGYLVLNAQLPDGAALDRTDKVVRKMSKLAREVPGVAHTIDLPGYSAVLGTNISNVGGMFVILDEFEKRAGIAELSAPAIIGRLREKFSAITWAVSAYSARHLWKDWEPRAGLLQVKTAGAGLARLQGAVETLQTKEIVTRDWPTYSAASASPAPAICRCRRREGQGPEINLKDIDAMPQAYLGSFYVNDFFFNHGRSTCRRPRAIE
jgi:multidrug efflux pump